MDIRQMEYFNVICETGSMSAAAQKLFVSQQALSKSLDLLEKEVGMPLLVRSRKGISLTRQGQAFRDEIQYVIRSKDRLLSRMDAIRKEYTDTLRIQFFSGMLLQLPEHYLEDFIFSHPEINFEIRSYLDNAQARENLNIDSDLFFTTNKINQIGMKLLYEVRSPLKVIVHKDHELAGKDSVRLADLCGFSVMTINSDYDIQNRIERLLQCNGIYTQYRLGDGELDMMMWLIRNRMVVSFFAGPEERMPSDTVMLNIEDLEFPWTYYVYGREGKLPKAAYEMLEDIRAFRE